MRARESEWLIKTGRERLRGASLHVIIRAKFWHVAKISLAQSVWAAGGSFVAVAASREQFPIPFAASRTIADGIRVRSVSGNGCVFVRPVLEHGKGFRKCAFDPWGRTVVLFQFTGTDCVCVCDFFCML